MFRLHHSAIRLLATTLLVVFGSALLGPVAALAQLRRQQPAAHLHLPGLPQAHHHHAEELAVHHPPAGQARAVKHAPHPHHACTHADEPPLAGLAPLLKLLRGAGAPALLAPPLAYLPGRLFQGWDRARAVVLVPPAQLRPKIPDLRIFLGSLLI